MFYYDCVMFCELRLLEALFDVKAVHFTPVRLVLSALLEAELDIRTLTPSRGLELADRPGGGLGSTTGNVQFPTRIPWQVFQPRDAFETFGSIDI